ncbi:TetR family transcriptional regulator [Acinetobacter radioresistens]|jgi:TetR/AcrR family transcriptional regulator, fatty acid biosynthesis regulator|uniref:TetR family transcriptional regulator n=2 Tax=Moraxellaceae TaxID=468 RepID=A0A2T1IZN4_ACIRA|nr:TetR family transcriptional regulator [Acinetobacter radioresistens]EJO36396.1 transcriptional regulator, TetR family [Acinetobacter radioresistens WC-A-157]MCK4078382.1 TetR family transcriptional regulator [Acinetobacter radioresistens]MCK4081125.1 TetR family transcriptional regulator [Acinetobacter radioresistens]MCK4084585.1 TetR family transcriptional regulator [Acinetobacter radioresistens]
MMSIRDERKQQSRQALLDAALRLSTSGRSFSSISLREVAREVGLVPTAFYRHFQDMDHLGQELLDQVALHLKTVLHQLGLAYLSQLGSKSQNTLQLFFQAVDQNPEPWIFMISERWGGSKVVRQAIGREIEFLIDDLVNDLRRIESLKHIQDENDLKVLSTILTNLSFTWAMTWISLSRQNSGLALKEQQEQFMQQAATELRFMFRGVSNWT